MSATDDVLKANRAYAKTFNQGDLSAPPLKKLAVLTCMDARIVPHLILGLQPGDAHVIRNAGGIATDDAIRSLVISHYLLGTQEVVVINHTDCGMLTFNEGNLLEKLQAEIGRFPTTPLHFHAFDDLQTNVRRQVTTIQSHTWMPDNIPVRGFIYDVRSGKLQEIPPND